jgi:recombination protein RecA
MWKVSRLGRLFQGAPVYLERKHPKTKKIYRYWRHQSQASPVLGKWREVLYKDGSKRIPNELSKYLIEPLALAVWYMDDGYFYQKDNNSYLSLGKVSEKEADIVRETLENNFGIKAKIYNKGKKGYALFFGVNETERLHELLRRHMIPLFNYKLLSK